jgi:asparagine synthase (glutamine-hydrolysing)
MCGICGKINPQGITQEEIQIMNNTLCHRVPYDQGIYLNGTAGLGYCRLSIIHLARDHQPMSNEDGSLWITFNGEISNYRELGVALRAPTHFQPEVILRLYCIFMRGKEKEQSIGRPRYGET